MFPDIVQILDYSELGIVKLYPFYTLFDQSIDKYLRISVYFSSMLIEFKLPN